ncbi:MAG TPA: HAMP domain-containing sensor histidine kinase, partial [Anaerolineales bacterium]|nr:HAMP domain-containing sensor histidine kinase [Anaerolineales bacterium]
MIRSLRNRLILSHILPALIIIPLMGAAMVYVLETRLLLPMIYRNLAKEATLMAEITRNEPVFWQDARIAQALADSVDPYLSGRLSLVTLDGHILASSETTNGVPGTQVVELPDLNGLSQGEVVEFQRGALAEVFTPVIDPNGNPIGTVRMTTRIVSISDQVYELRYLLGAVLLFSVLAGIGLGSYLALGINRPIQRVTQSIQNLADGHWHAHLEEQGPEEIRTLAKAVNALVDQLNSLEQARRQLLANLVHELGRPLGAVRSAIQAMMKGADKEPQLAQDLLTGMESETARLQRLLEDLAELHEQVLGKLELNRSQIQVDDWLVGILSPWEAAAREKGLAWSVQLPSELPVIQMDSDRMAQAIGNLLSNAIKFTPAGGKVSIAAQMDNGQLIVQVEDTGPGIPMDEQSKIFQ